MSRPVIICPDCSRHLKLAKNGSIPEHLSRGRGRRGARKGQTRWDFYRCNGLESGRAAILAGGDWHWVPGARTIHVDMPARYTLVRALSWPA